MERYESNTVIFINNVIYGSLKKHVIETKMFQLKQQYERIYILDFNRAKMIIKHHVNDNENSEQAQVFPFGEIKSC